MALAEQEDRFRTIGVKLGPGVDMRAAAEDLFACVEAVSFDGECREVCSWLSRGASRGISAMHVESGERLVQSAQPPTTDKPGAILFHADPAAIKARCLGTLTKQFDLTALGDSDGYLTGDRLVESPWLRPYRVLWSGHADRKQTQAALLNLSGQITEVKTRGTKEPATSIQSAYKPGGPRPLTLAVWPLEKSLRHALIEPMTP
jgi:hypothetical protein